MGFRRCLHGCLVHCAGRFISSSIAVCNFELLYSHTFHSLSVNHIFEFSEPYLPSHAIQSHSLRNSRVPNNSDLKITPRLLQTSKSLQFCIVLFSSEQTETIISDNHPEQTETIVSDNHPITYLISSCLVSIKVVANMLPSTM